MRRRLITILAAVLAAGTLFSAAGAASASGAAVHRRICESRRVVFLHVTKSGVNYYAGTPNTTFAGATVRLKAHTDFSTQWTVCAVESTRGPAWVLFNRNLVLTTSGVPGSAATVQRVGNFGGGTNAQRWLPTFSGNTVTLQNVRSSQFLRVRNSGPIYGQTVAAGFTPTFWLP
jgi:hypothetical protein